MISMEQAKLLGKLQRLGDANFKRDKTLPVLSKGSLAWKAWRRWREDNGLGVAFMDCQDRWTVPCENPPVDIDALLEEAERGGRKRVALAR